MSCSSPIPWESVLEAVSEEVGRQLRPIAERLDSLATRLEAQAPDRLLTREEAAALLRVDVRTLRRLVLAGDAPPPLAIGERLVRWRHRDLLRFLEAA